LIEPHNGVQMPLAPFLWDGAEALPLYEMDCLMTREAAAEFYRAYFARRNGNALWIPRITGAALFAVGAYAYIGRGAGGVLAFCLATGAALLFMSLFGTLASPRMAQRYLRSMGGPAALCYRFFEEGFEVYADRGMQRRPYSDLFEVFESRGALHLYVGKARGFMLTREAVAGRLEELIAFFERKTGKGVVRVGKVRLR